MPTAPASPSSKDFPSLVCPSAIGGADCFVVQQMLKLFKQEKGKKMKVIFALIDLIVQVLFWALVGLGKILMLLYRLATYLLKRLVKSFLIL